MYKGIRIQGYRNLSEVRINDKSELVVGLRAAIVRKRTNRRTREDNFSITTDAILTKIEDTDGHPTLTFQHEGKDQILQWFRRANHNTQNNDYYYSTFIVNQEKVNVWQVVNSRLFYIRLFTDYTVGPAFKGTAFEIPVFADSIEEAKDILTSQLKVNFHFGGDFTYREIDMNDLNSPFKVKHE